MKTIVKWLLPALVLAGPGAYADGKAVYEKNCALCHGSGLAGAPKFGNAAEWAPRVKAGVAKLYASALNGTPKGMPGKGGNLALSEAEVKSAVDYLVAAVGGAKAAAAPAVEKKVPAEKKPVASAPATKPAPEVKKVAAAAPVPAAGVVPPAAPATPVTTRPSALASANSFNRLLAPPNKRNPPPAEDGIHDPASAGTTALQPPLAAFTGMPPLNSGNRINWVKSLDGQRIQPRWDRENPDAPAVVMDLNIVREVKGSMPDVVYPHKQHTEWLDCNACHPAIFIPQKGANKISMASIMLGQHCGVCHGKVAFPVSECRLCHSKSKSPAAPTRTAGKEGN